jgi:hypothetical protein
LSKLNEKKAHGAGMADQGQFTIDNCAPTGKRRGQTRSRNKRMFFVATSPAYHGKQAELAKG